MARVIDITDKLESDENPILEMRGKKVEVNGDAETVLKIMGMMRDGISEESAIDMFEFLFSKEERKKLLNQKLSFSNLMVVIQEAMSAITGTDTEKETLGEATTRTTT